MGEDLTYNPEQQKCIELALKGLNLAILGSVSSILLIFCNVVAIRTQSMNSPGGYSYFMYE